MTTKQLTQVSNTKVAGGYHQQFSHFSSCLNCDMQFAIFLPPQYQKAEKLPVLYWLSGLTCTDENFMQKAAAFNKAAELGMIIVAPDTSPRGKDVSNDDGYDLGQGAGFYLNATQAPWQANYQMYDYIVHELPALIMANFSVSTKRSISGHSMGGHGAITIGLKNTDKYQSISAFSPICNPIDCPWGQKAFTAYLGTNKATWHQYDSCELMKQATIQLPMLISQGTADNFLQEQLKTQHLIDAAKISHYPVTVNMEEGYDHSYFFISTFIEQHIAFHAKYLM